ncbi:MAG: hypothetical protein JSR92_19930 [Proteobacteria bacterium]|nr:hypothetical protein [Pseudomonadota bacterium]
MAHAIGFVDNTGSEGLAHWQMLATLKTLGEANGWTTLRYTTPTDGSPRELILRGVGLSGTEQIFIGFRTYHSVTSDYYNMTVASFDGYVAASPFVNQPGYQEAGLCAHNHRIDYWVAVNAQRFAFALKVGTPVYEMAYVGKYFPYATPNQYPYPMAVCGTLDGPAATRYSDVTAAHSSGVKGALPQGALRTVGGTWYQFRNQPFTGENNNAAAIRRDTGGQYDALKSVLYGDGNVWGELDGVRYICGFDNVVENTAAIAGKAQVVVQDVFRTGIGDYFLLELD